MATELHLKIHEMTLLTLLGIAVALAMDAFAVAGGFTIIGMQLGVRIARLSQIATWAEILGGLVLWFIGLRILAENGVFT
jgi:putative Mn2+ efflux pump MntP